MVKKSRHITSNDNGKLVEKLGRKAKGPYLDFEIYYGSQLPKGVFRYEYTAE